MNTITRKDQQEPLIMALFMAVLHSESCLVNFWGTTLALANEPT